MFVQILNTITSAVFEMFLRFWNSARSACLIREIRVGIFFRTLAILGNRDTEKERCVKLAGTNESRMKAPCT